MINDVMNEIAEAEKKAEAIVAAAVERARNISLSAQSEAESIKTEFALALKEKIGEINKAAERDGDREVADVMKQAQDAAAAVAKVNEKTFAKCVEQVAELITKRNA